MADSSNKTHSRSDSECFTRVDSNREQLFTDTQLEVVTGLSSSFWRARRLKGDGPIFIKISARAVRYRWGDVQSWLDSLRRTSTSDQGAA